MDLSCTTYKYDILYARWLQNPGKLLDMAGWEPGMTLLDLCGGTGAVSREALRRGAQPEDIVLVDLNPRALDLGITQIRTPAEDAWLHDDLKHDTFDVIVCRQAIAYVDFEKPPVSLFLGMMWLLKPGGRFVFNTFVKPRWSAKSYVYEGRTYFEASFPWKGKVWHLQWCSIAGANWTRFDWHRKEDLLAEATCVFKDRVEVIETPKTLYFRCRKADAVP